MEDCGIANDLVDDGSLSEDDSVGPEPTVALDEELFPANEDNAPRRAAAGRSDGHTGRKWKVDHSSGDHEFRAHRFIEKTLSDGFEPADALKVLQVKHTIDFGSSGAGARHARPTGSFYLDCLSIVGKLGRPISRRDAPILDNMTVSFQKWVAP